MTNDTAMPDTQHPLNREALVALLNPWRSKPGEVRYWLMLLGLFGACLLYGDATTTLTQGSSGVPDLHGHGQPMQSPIPAPVRRACDG